MRPRRRKINRLDDRNLRNKGIAVTSRAADALASAMKNLLKEKPEATLEHLVDVFDHLMEAKVIDNEIWRRYTRKKRDDRRKAEEIKGLLQSPPVTDEHYEQGMSFVVLPEET